MVNQRGNILGSHSQRRQADRHHAQPVIEILAESPLGDLFQQVARAGGDDARVDVADRRFACMSEFTILKHLQQPHLERRRQRLDFVQQQRATVRCREAALAGRAAMRAHQWSAREGAQLMNGPRDQPFARAGFAEQQHIGIRPRDLPHKAVNFLHRRRGTDDLGDRRPERFGVKGARWREHGFVTGTPFCNPANRQSLGQHARSTPPHPRPLSRDGERGEGSGSDA